MVRSKSIALSSVLIAVGSIMYIFESFIPFPVPFGKWGLSNFVVLLSAYNFGLRTTILIAIGKSVVGNLVTGHFFDPVFFMSLAGSFSSGLVQFAVLQTNLLGLFGTSLLGSITNNLIQALIGSALIKSSAFLILIPYMLLLGIPGAFTNALIVRKVGDYVSEVDIGFDLPKTRKNIENDLQKLRNSGPKNPGNN